MTTIINLTQHTATPAQVEAGVVDLPVATTTDFGVVSPRARLAALLTFDSLPSGDEIFSRATEIACLAAPLEGETAMIGGAPYLMPELARQLDELGIRPVYAFSRRVSVEKTLPDGKVVKTNEFVHEGFVGHYVDNIS